MMRADRCNHWFSSFFYLKNKYSSYYNRFIHYLTHHAIMTTIYRTLRGMNLLKSLQTRLILTLSISLLASGIGMSYYTYSTSQRVVIESIGKQAQTIANAAAELVDPRQYEELKETMQMNDYYNDLQQQLYQLKQSNGLKYLYTMSVAEDG